MAEKNHISAEELVDLMINKWNNQPKKNNFDAKDVHVKALDDLVNVNSLFTLAVFVGLSQAVPDARSLDGRDECNAGPGVGKMLVVYEVTAFACLLLSSLIAKVLKLHFSLDGQRYDFISRRFDMKDFLLIVTASASVSGIVLLTLSVVNIVQIRLGVYSCGSPESRQAIWALCLIVGIALVVYVVSLSIAIFASIKGDAIYDAFPTRRFMPENKVSVPPSPVEGKSPGRNVLAMRDFGVDDIV